MGLFFEGRREGAGCFCHVNQLFFNLEDAAVVLLSAGVRDVDVRQQLKGGTVLQARLVEGVVDGNRVSGRAQKERACQSAAHRRH